MVQAAYIEEPNPLALTAEDVNRLLTDTSADTRIDMTGRIAAAYNGRALGKIEIIIAEQIFRLLLHDTELRVRATLAQCVKDSDCISRDIVLKLAKDVETVALPVLECSKVLTDDDLAEIIHTTQESSRCQAISRRPFISEMVCDLLLGRNDKAVTRTLVGNEGARISERGMQRAAETWQDDDSLKQAIATRSSRVPVAAAEKLVHAVAETLGETLREKYNLASEQMEREVEKTREKETLHLIRQTDSDDDADRLILQLQAGGRLTPSIILSALCQGNSGFFETALARLSSIPVANARKLISDRGELGFRAIYNKSGLPDAMFPAVKLLLKIVHELHEEGEKKGGASYANRIVERILQYSEGSEMENLSYIIALVRRVAQ